MTHPFEFNQSVGSGLHVWLERSGEYSDPFMITTTDVRCHGSSGTTATVPVAVMFEFCKASHVFVFRIC